MSDPGSRALNGSPLPSDIDSSVFGQKSPLIRHLEGLVDTSPSAAILLRVVRTLPRPHTSSMRMSAHATDMDFTGIADDFVVQLLHISSMHQIEIKHTVRRDQLYGLFFGHVDSMLIVEEDLLAAIRETCNDIHTTVVVVQPFRDGFWGYCDLLLVLHVIIVEMEVAPVNAIRMLRSVSIDLLKVPGVVSRFGIPHAEVVDIMDIIDAEAAINSTCQGNAFLTFGFTPSASFALNALSWTISVMHLDSCNVQGRPAETVLVCTDQVRFEQAVRLASPHPLKRENHHDYGGGYFLSDVAGPIRKLRPRGFDEHLLSRNRITASQIQSHWIKAMIETVISRYSIKPWIYRDSLSRVSDEDHECWCQIAEAAYQAAKLDLIRLEAFLLLRSPSGDHSLALQSFRILIEELKSDYERMIATFNRRATFRSIEMARLSINESRSTIRLTWLATVFIPISLASSIFGMNVREIDASSTGVWQFAVLSVVLLALSAYSWCLSRALRNYKLCVQRSHKIYLHWHEKPKEIYDILFKECRKSRVRVLWYLLGFRRVEELGFRDERDVLI